MAAWLPLPSGFTGYATRFVVSLFSKQKSCHFFIWELEALSCLSGRLVLFISRGPKHFKAQLLNQYPNLT
jgi:hypothetical protein